MAFYFSLILCDADICTMRQFQRFRYYVFAHLVTELKLIQTKKKRDPITNNKE